MASLSRVFSLQLKFHQKTLTRRYASVLHLHSLFSNTVSTSRYPMTCQGCLLHTSTQRPKSGETEPIDPMSTPIKFSTSEARTWKARNTYFVENKAPFYQPFVVILSVGAILLYFCILREENDFDEELNAGLFQRIPGLEEKQLRTNILYNKEHGKDTTDLEARLQEIQEMGPAARRVQD